MPTWLIIILLAILAVGLFVLAMSLTLIFKGHHIDSEISTNENMRKLGIKCAVQETREQMTGLEDCASPAPPKRQPQYTAPQKNNRRQILRKPKTRAI